MNIKHPEFLFLIVFIPLFVGFIYYVWKKRVAALKKLCHPSQIAKLFPNSGKRRVIFRYILLSLAFTLFIVSFISPRWGYDWKEVETKGTNIFIVLDVSRSMLANDIAPDRITRAKYEITKLLDKLTGDTVGLIIFAGEAFLQAPLTHDYLMVKEWVSQLKVGAVPVMGTSVKQAIYKAMKGFKYAKTDSKAIILISDGEEHDEETIRAARKAKTAGIKIYSIGVGTSSGSPIPDKGALVKDQNGNIVLSKLNDELLKEVAEETGGYYVRSTTGDFHLDNLYYDHIKRELSLETLKSGKSKLWYETYQIFSGIALFLLLLELLMTFDWRLWRSFRIPKTFKQLNLRKKTDAANNGFKPVAEAAAVIALLLVSGLFVPAKAVLDINEIRGDRAIKNQNYKKAKSEYIKVQVKDPHNPRLNYNLGVAFYKDKMYKEAIAAFDQSARESTDPLLKASALHNLGNAHFKAQEFNYAVDAYKKALKLNPETKDTKFNLALAERFLEEDEDEGEQEEDDNSDQNDDNQDDQKDNQDKNNDKEKEDQKKKEQEEKERKQKEEEERKKREKERKQEQRRKNIDQLLKQIPEANSQDVNQDRMKQETQNQGSGGGAPAPILNPW